MTVPVESVKLGCAMLKLGDLNLRFRESGSCMGKFGCLPVASLASQLVAPIKSFLVLSRRHLRSLVGRIIKPAELG
ncbi:hypothetical protein [Pseudonocardia charpentierae]|uniref:Uncharacterized protein n=1 Tax=Pseudonocardia charpentierae TaxID=3075545 RepID=A0ABU2NG32_9PSEU|nr:hypothetical protein [Pseudonocardia sp. DSM 45834]MDT0352920.1 hypothetical protein [Pseudonocardia sp. DSM 45834]